jgi:hypothetical protein
LRVAGIRTSKAVGHSHVLAIVLSEKHTDHTFPCSLGLTTVVICGGEEHERRNRDVAGHKRQRLCCCGGHLVGSHSVCRDKGDYGRGRGDNVGVDGGGGVVVWC